MATPGSTPTPSNSTPWQAQPEGLAQFLNLLRAVTNAELQEQITQVKH